MDEDQEQEQTDQIKLQRMKELEAMVQKLTMENEILLTQVKGGTEDTPLLPNGKESDELSISLQITTPSTTPRDNHDDTELIPLNDADLEEDTWLYVSPIRPPTREQKSVTPLQWLSEGRDKRKGSRHSFLDIKKSLDFTRNEAEQLTNPPAETNKGRVTPTNKTAQKYLNQVRLRRSSQSESEDSASERHSPVPVDTTLRIKKPRNINVVRPVIPSGPPGRFLGRNPEESLPKWSVKQVKDETVNSEQFGDEEGYTEMAQPLMISSSSPPRLPSETQPAGDLSGLRVKRRPISNVKGVSQQQQQQRGMKQVSNVRKRLPNDEEQEVEEEVPQTRKWKVKQVPDLTKHASSEEEEEIVPQTRKWKVKQVPERSTWTEIESSPPLAPSDSGGEEETGGQQERKWKVKQVPERSTWTEIDNSPPLDSGGEEESGQQKRKWKVKQVPDQQQAPPTDEDKGAAEEEQGEEGEGEGEGKREVTVKRSGTFTKDKPKPYVRRSEETGGRESSASDRTMSPVEMENLKVKWTPRNTSPSSSEEDSRRTHSPASPRDSPANYQEPARHVPRLPVVSRGRGQIRVPSPARHSAHSPLQQQRKASGEGMVITSRSPSPSNVLPQKHMTPPMRGLRPPSPRRTSQLPSPSANQTTPTKIRSHSVGQTTPTNVRPQGVSQTTPTSSRLQSVGQTTPTNVRSSLSPKGVSPTAKGRGEAPTGIKIAKPLTPSPNAPRRRTLPVTPPSAPKLTSSPRGARGGKFQPPVHRGSDPTGNVKIAAKAPAPQGGEDDSWLDECF